MARALARVRVLGQLVCDPLERGGLPGDVAGGGVDRRERLRDPQRLDPAREEPLEERDGVALLRRPEAARVEHGERELRRLRVAREGLGQELGTADLERRTLGARLARREPPEHRGALLGRMGARDCLERGVQPPERRVVLAERERVAPRRGGALGLGGVEPQGPEPR